MGLLTVTTRIQPLTEDVIPLQPLTNPLGVNRKIQIFYAIAADTGIRYRIEYIYDLHDPEPGETVDSFDEAFARKLEIEGFVQLDENNIPVREEPNVSGLMVSIPNVISVDDVNSLSEAHAVGTSLVNEEINFAYKKPIYETPNISKHTTVQNSAKSSKASSHKVIKRNTSKSKYKFKNVSLSRTDVQPASCATIQVSNSGKHATTFKRSIKHTTVDYPVQSVQNFSSSMFIAD